MITDIALKKKKRSKKKVIAKSYVNILLIINVK